MASSSSTMKNQGVEVRNVQLVMSDVCPLPNFCGIPDISMKGDLMGELSLIPNKVIMIHDVQSCYMCEIGKFGDYEICVAYEKLCNECKLKDEFKIVERKGLTCVLDFTWNFKIEWTKVILRRIHDMKLWLENGPIEILKKVIHNVT